MLAYLTLLWNYGTFRLEMKNQIVTKPLHLRVLWIISQVNMTTSKSHYLASQVKPICPLLQKQVTPPLIFESTGLNVSDFAMTLPDDLFNNTKTKFAVSNAQEISERYPTGITIPVIYVNSTMGSLESTNTLDSIFTMLQRTKSIYGY